MPNAAMKAQMTPANTNGFFISLNIDESNTAVNMYFATSRN